MRSATNPAQAAYPLPSAGTAAAVRGRPPEVPLGLPRRRAFWLTLFAIAAPCLMAAGETPDRSPPATFAPQTVDVTSEIASRPTQVVIAARPWQDAASDAQAESRDDGLRTIRGLSVDIRPAAGDLPGSPASARFAELGEVRHELGTSRAWPSSCYGWEAPAVCYRPLYFEQVNLERYGYSCGVAQPLVSAAHFFGTIPALPYLIAAQPCGECVYTLGHYRPGSCAPFHLYRPPLSLRGAAAEAGVVTGLIFAIP
ncbi:MAG: hypothetical protein MUF25_20830 [Pirellulaceae bacterium]|nr:hypothetical protein [Pirellulaceae bacterium]